MAADKVHVAVDLNGWMPGGRPGILAMRPAPVQVKLAAWPQGLGYEIILASSERREKCLLTRTNKPETAYIKY